MDAGLQSSAFAKGKGRRLPGLHLALISAAIGAALAASGVYTTLSPRHSTSLECDPRRSKPAIIQAAFENQTSSDVAAATAPTFKCPSPIPCHPRASNAGDQAKDQSGAWNLDMIPLARQTLKYPGRAGICETEVSQRAFQVSGIDYESLVNFEPCELFNVIQNRTLWIFGDSQLLGFHRTLLSFMAEFSKNPQDVRKEVPIGIPTVDFLLTYTENPKHKTKPLCNDLVNNTRICYVRLLRMSFKEFQYAMEILTRAIPQFRHDVVLFNVGLHYQAAIHRPNLARDLQALADYRQHVRTTMGEGFLPLTLWIDTPPQHFSLPKGEYDLSKNLTADMCAPFDEERIARGDRSAFNKVSDDYIANISDAHVKTWGVAERSHFSHLGSGDCTHFCGPGVPELWAFVLAKTIAQARPPCVLGQDTAAEERRGGALGE